MSTAGTPTVSDPGYRLINEAASHDVPLVPVPGVSAAAAALSVSGLPTDRFAFVGFLPKKKARKVRQLEQLAQESQTLIFYESPKRIITLLREIIDAMGDRQGVMAREMTKRHEEFIRGTLSQIIENLEARSGVKGECTLLVAGRDESSDEQWDAVKHEIQDMLKSSTEPVSALVQKISQKHGLPKNRVYKEALKFKSQK